MVTDTIWYESPLFGVLIGAVIGFFTSFFAKILWNWYSRPIIELHGIRVYGITDIQGKEHKEIELEGEEHKEIFYSNRLIVINRGKSPAEDCKAYLLTEMGEKFTLKVAWVFPTNRESYTTTLNVNDEEFIDLCAMNYSGSKRLLSTERGYVIDSSHGYLPPGTFSGTVRITSKNTQAITREVQIYNQFGELKDDNSRLAAFIV